jgi:nucleoside-diphosphate-sugar epimerase
LKRFVYLSSLAATGPSSDGKPSTETMEPNPVSSYGRSKLEGERATWRHRDVIPVTIIRPPAVYGPRDRDFHLFFRMVKKGFYPYWGKCYYSLLYIDDLVRGLIEASVARKAATGVYFLSDGMVYSNEDIMNEIREVLGTKVLKVRIPKAIMSLVAGIGEGIGRGTSIINRDKMKELSHSFWVCDPKKAEREYGFMPKVLLKEGIKWTADWYRIHQWL